MNIHDLAWQQATKWLFMILNLASLEWWSALTLKIQSVLTIPSYGVSNVLIVYNSLQEHHPFAIFNPTFIPASSSSNKDGSALFLEFVSSFCSTSNIETLANIDRYDETQIRVHHVEAWLLSHPLRYLYSGPFSPHLRLSGSGWDGDVANHRSRWHLLPQARYLSFDTPLNFSSRLHTTYSVSLPLQRQALFHCASVPNQDRTAIEDNVGALLHALWNAKIDFRPTISFISSGTIRLPMLCSWKVFVWIEWVRNIPSFLPPRLTSRVRQVKDAFLELDNSTSILSVFDIRTAELIRSFKVRCYSIYQRC